MFASALSVKFFVRQQMKNLTNRTTSVAIAAAVVVCLTACKPADDAGKNGVGAMKSGDATDSALGSSSTAPVAAASSSGASSASPAGN